MKKKDDKMDHFDPEPEEDVTEDGSEIWVWLGKTDPIKVEVNKFKGKHYLNVRKWYLPKEGNLDPGDTKNYLPTKNGINVEITSARKLLQAMEKCLESALHED